MRGNTHLHLLLRPEKMGLGTAYQVGIIQALQHSPEYVVQMDADFSHDLSYVPNMLDLLRKKYCDVVVGSRYIKGGGVSSNWSFLRKGLSALANIYARALLGLKVHDATSGFKIFRRESLEKIDLHNVSSQGYVFQIEVALKCKKNNIEVCEYPILFQERSHGESKIDMPIILESIFKVIALKINR
jgi:dolichol-phosphate mannosyltransferase